MLHRDHFISSFTADNLDSFCSISFSEVFSPVAARARPHSVSETHTAVRGEVDYPLSFIASPVAYQQRDDKGTLLVFRNDLCFFVYN